jgi:hypothetical protein
VNLTLRFVHFVPKCAQNTSANKSNTSCRLFLFFISELVHVYLFTQRSRSPLCFTNTFDPRYSKSKKLCGRGTKMMMRKVRFGPEEEFAPVPLAGGLNVVSSTIGATGVELALDVAKLCVRLNAVNRMLFKVALDDYGKRFNEAVAQDITGKLQSLLAHVICKHGSVRVVDINLRIEGGDARCKVPTLAIQLSDGTWVVGNGDISVLNTYDNVEFCILATEMKVTVTAEFLGQLASEIIAFDGLQTPGTPRVVSEIVAKGAHMCSGVISNGLQAVGMTLLTPEDASASRLPTTKEGHPQTLFFLETAGINSVRTPEGNTMVHTLQHDWGPFHLIALHLLRADERLLEFVRVSVDADTAVHALALGDTDDDNASDDDKRRDDRLPEQSARAARLPPSKPTHESTTLNTRKSGSHSSGKQKKSAPLSDTHINVRLGKNPSGWRGVPAGADGSHPNRVISWGTSVGAPP